VTQNVGVVHALTDRESVGTVLAVVFVLEPVDQLRPAEGLLVGLHAVALFAATFGFGEFLSDFGQLTEEKRREGGEGERAEKER
jgi:hypothetical protein